MNVGSNASNSTTVKLVKLNTLGALFLILSYRILQKLFVKTGKRTLYTTIEYKL
ncbi:MAG: hypothetical protein LBB41_02895 [Prevotellaceae bacterium]|nr:hypothetical protein [Prevotellaceae bacterium]